MIILLFLFAIGDERERDKTVISLSMLNKSLPLRAVFHVDFRSTHHLLLLRLELFLSPVLMRTEQCIANGSLQPYLCERTMHRPGRLTGC